VSVAIVRVTVAVSVVRIDVEVVLEVVHTAYLRTLLVLHPLCSDHW
jgi:hypothetical protein